MAVGRGCGGAVLPCCGAASAGAQFRRVGVPRAHVLCLQVLELRVHREALLARHRREGGAGAKGADEGPDEDFFFLFWDA